MIEGKSLGGKRICRVNVSLTNAENQKLSKLATACNMPPTTLAWLLITRCLDDPLLVSQLQDEYGVYNAYKVVPVNHDGEIHYSLRDRYGDS